MFHDRLSMPLPVLVTPAFMGFMETSSLLETPNRCGQRVAAPPPDPLVMAKPCSAWTQAGRGSLHREIAVARDLVGGERVRVALPDDPAFLQNEVAVGETQQGIDGLVDHQDGEAVALEGGEAIPDLLADQGRQTLRGLVEHQQL